MNEMAAHFVRCLGGGSLSAVTSSCACWTEVFLWKESSVRCKNGEKQSDALGMPSSSFLVPSIICVAVAWLLPGFLQCGTGSWVHCHFALFGWLLFAAAAGVLGLCSGAGHCGECEKADCQCPLPCFCLW
jgi:hypothetical protein